jgi:hypothetical protein
VKEDSSALEVFRVMDSTNLSGVAVTDALTGKLVGDLCTADLAYFLKLHVSLRLPVLTFRARGVAQQLAATRCVRASCTPLHPCACIAHPSCTMHHASCIPHASCSMHRASLCMHRTSLMHHAACIVHPCMHRASLIPHASCIAHSPHVQCV